MTTEAKLLVARGVDALRLYVEVSTIEPASTRPTYNDHLTYLIQSPLIGIVGGTFNIAALGSQNPLVIFQPEWRVCHAKTLSANSYVTVRLTAQNVNSADHPIRNSKYGCFIRPMPSITRADPLPMETVRETISITICRPLLGFRRPPMGPSTTGRAPDKVRCVTLPQLDVGPAGSGAVTGCEGHEHTQQCADGPPRATGGR